MDIDGVTDLAAQTGDAPDHGRPFDHPHRVTCQVKLRVDGLAATALHQHLLVDVDGVGKGKTRRIARRHGELRHQHVISAIIQPRQGLLERHHGMELHGTAHTVGNHAQEVIVVASQCVIIGVIGHR